MEDVVTVARCFWGSKAECGFSGHPGQKWAQKLLVTPLQRAVDEKWKRSSAEDAPCKNSKNPFYTSTLFPHQKVLPVRPFFYALNGDLQILSFYSFPTKVLPDYYEVHALTHSCSLIDNTVPTP